MSRGAQEACQREPLRCPRLGGGSRQGLLRALAHERRGTPLSSLYQSIRAPGLRQEVSAKFVGNPGRQETVSHTSYSNVCQHFVLSNPSFLQGLWQKCPIFKDFPGIAVAPFMGRANGSRSVGRSSESASASDP